jgi:hypothetical protein
LLKIGFHRVIIALPQENSQAMNIPRLLSLLTVSLGLALGASVTSLCAQEPWTARQPPAAAPLYPPGTGPVVTVDEAHFNFHTTGGRYRELARILERDGYVVRPERSPLSGNSLRGTRILIIATPLSARNRDPAKWSPPIYPAFSDAEIRALREWVHGGGALLLIADHLPFAGAMEKLAAAFGFELINGYALDRREIRQASLDRPFVFTRDGKQADGTLADHPITRGRVPAERVERVMTFMGAAFRAKEPAEPLLVFGKYVSSYQTATFGKLSATTPSAPAAGWLQAAARHYGKGRVVLFSEAGMFMARTRDAKPIGLAHPDAGGNYQLFLNTLHWLDGMLK